MGNFYTNITLRGVGQDEVTEFLTRQGTNAYVTPTKNEFTVVCEERCDTQEQGELERVASELSARFHCPTLVVLNHDDDILWFKLYSDGAALDEYNSAPGYFEGDDVPPYGGNAHQLCEIFGAGQNAAEVERILRSPDGSYRFAYERHIDLARALGLPSYTVGLGFNYLEEDETPLDDLDIGALKRTGG
ncbi:MAG: hypothetical protein DMF67_19450 [Acidobacteria bacterium]|nr:MAG: hypothetical protein DMF67_19450 [Acidobacteriota bacterium]